MWLYFYNASFLNYCADKCRVAGAPHTRRPQLPSDVKTQTHELMS